GGPSAGRPSPCPSTSRRRSGRGAEYPASSPSASARSPTSLLGTCATVAGCSTRAMTSEPLERLNAALAGRYALAHELGSGGMATVYLADDLKHHRPVAVKVLRPELASVLAPERFLREVEIAARLNHPHILALYDCGEAAGLLFYVMPYVKGESLRHPLDRQQQLPSD